VVYSTSTNIRNGAFKASTTPTTIAIIPETAETNGNLTMPIENLEKQLVFILILIHFVPNISIVYEDIVWHAHIEKRGF